MSKTRQNTMLFGAMAAFVLTVMAFALWKWVHLAYNGMDLAIFSQALWNTAHGRFLATSIHPPSLLGDHAEWVVLALTPLYALVPHPLVLVFVQALALALTAWVTWRIARRMLPEGWALGAAVGVLLIPTLGSAALYEFHPLVFALPLLLLAADAYQEKRFVRFLLWCGACLLVREDVALTVAMFGLISLVDRRSSRWVLTPALAGVAWFAAMNLVISSVAIGGSYKFFAYYGWLWPLNPLVVIQHLFSLPQFEFLLGMILPVFFLPVLKPRWLLLSIPSVFMIMLTDAGGSGTVLAMHYGAVPMAGIVMAGLAGLVALKSGNHWAARATHFFASDGRLLAITLGTALVASAVLLGPFARGLLLLRSPLNNAGYASVMSHIPNTAAVAVSYRSLPNLANREQLIALRYLALGTQQFASSPYSPSTPDFIVFDDTDFLLQAADADLSWAKNYYPVSFSGLRRLVDSGYGLVLRDGELNVWQHGAPRPEFNLTAHERAEIAPHVTLAVADTPELCPGHRGTCTVFILEADQKTKDDLFLQITATAGNKKTSVLRTFRILPSFDWQPGQRVTLPLPALPEIATTGSVTYQAQLVRARISPTLDALGTTIATTSGLETIGAPVTFARTGLAAGTPAAVPTAPK